MFFEYIYIYVYIHIDIKINPPALSASERGFLKILFLFLPLDVLLIFLIITFSLGSIPFLVLSVASSLRGADAMEESGSNSKYG